MISVHTVNRNWGVKIYHGPKRIAYVFKGGCEARGLMTAAMDGLPAQYVIEGGKLVPYHNNLFEVPQAVLAQVKRLLS